MASQSKRLPPLEPKDRPRQDGNINGNVYSVIGQCVRTLKRAGKKAYAEELLLRVENQEFKTYGDVLNGVQEYVTFEFGEAPADDRPEYLRGDNGDEDPEDEDGDGSDQHRH